MKKRFSRTLRISVAAACATLLAVPVMAGDPCDLDGDGVFGEQGEKLLYHLGKNSFLGNITLTPNEKLEGGANDFRINVDLEKMLEGVDFNTEKFTKTGADEIDIANKVFANYATAFSFEK